MLLLNTNCYIIAIDIKSILLYTMNDFYIKDDEYAQYY